MIRRGAFVVIAAAVSVLPPVAVLATDRVVAANYPPLMITAEGERPGYAVEVLREAARRAGRDFELTFLPFERAIFALKNEPATLMPALFHGKPDDHKFLWLEEIHRARLVFATVAGRVDDLETARGLSTIVLEAGNDRRYASDQAGVHQSRAGSCARGQCPDAGERGERMPGS